MPDENNPSAEDVTQKPADQLNDEELKKVSGGFITIKMENIQVTSTPLGGHGTDTSK